MKLNVDQAVVKGTYCTLLYLQSTHKAKVRTGFWGGKLVAERSQSLLESLKV